MKFALMQPYFIPYIGYWQLMNEVDVFVLSDDSKYIKQSWINRNRLWINQRIDFLTLPLKKDSDFLGINERQIATDYDASHLMQRSLHDYRKCKNNSVEELLYEILNQSSRNLGTFLELSIDLVMKFLGLKCKVLNASTMQIPPDVKGKNRIFFVGEKLEIEKYVNLPGGKALYSVDEFRTRGFELQFISPNLAEYPVKFGKFVHSLSIIDLLFQAKHIGDIQFQLQDYSLLGTTKFQ